MTELDRIRYVTQYYAHLQGLRLVPLGLLFLAAAAWRSGWLVLPGAADRAEYWFVGGFWIAIGVSFWIRARYQRQFGHLRPLPGRNGFWFFMGLLACVLGALALEEVGRWPFAARAPLVVVVGCLMYLGLAHGALRKHYLIVAFAVLGLIGAQRLGLSPDREQALFDVVIGGGLMIAGLGDDRLLRRLLQSPSSEVYAGTP